MPRCRGSRAGIGRLAVVGTGGVMVHLTTGHEFASGRFVSCLKRLPNYRSELWNTKEAPRMRLSTLTYLMVLTGAGFAGSVAQAADVAVPPEKCKAAWSMASPGGDTIAKGAVTPVVLDFTMVDSNKDGAIDQGWSDRPRRVQQGLLGRAGQGQRSDREGHGISRHWDADVSSGRGSEGVPRSSADTPFQVARLPKARMPATGTMKPIVTAAMVSTGRLA